MAGPLGIRPLREADRDAWEPLWQGYLAFYETTLAPEITDASFHRFLDPMEPLHGLVAEIDGRLAGLAHFLLHRSTWAPECYCYLEDLFVAPDLRGYGVGRALIAAVETAARDAHATRLYWSTRERNAAAQRLYDQVAARSDFIQYRKRLD